MADSTRHDAWSAGHSYERYMGRWSRAIAGRFLDWLDAPKHADWLDIGCGTGALTGAILERCTPASVLGIDPSEGFVAHAGKTVADPRARFLVGTAEALPLAAQSVDIAASALVLNFVPDRVGALQQMMRVTRPGGLVSFYVWDYPGGGMGFIDAFWKAAGELDPGALELDEGQRFPFCTRDRLAGLCREAGLSGAEIEPIEIDTVFADFSDFWQPFTLGAGPAPGYFQSLDEPRRRLLQTIVARNIGAAEPVALKARAWAAKSSNG